MWNISCRILETSGYTTLGKMLKLSSASCRKFCWCNISLPHFNKKVELFTGRSYVKAVLRTHSSMLESNRQQENIAANCFIIKKCSRQTQRLMATDISAQEGREENQKSIDINSLVDELFVKAIERDRMVAVVPKSAVSKHIVTLVNAGFQKSDVLNLHRYPEIIKNLAPLTELIVVLLDYGIQKDDIANIVNVYPGFVHKTKSDVLFKIDKLHEIGFTSDSIVTMIVNYPAVLDSDLTGVPQRVEDLKLIFKTKDTFRLLEKTPNLLFCDMSYILERFNYVFLEMGITQPQMRYSNLFSYPMDHIHARHMFVERAGFFKKCKKRKGQIDLNPKLDTIIDTTDAEFVKKFGNMTVRDYQTFKKLLLKDRVVLKHAEDYSED